MQRFNRGCRRALAIAIACSIAAACSHSARPDSSGSENAQRPGGEMSASRHQASAPKRPPHPSDGYRLAEIAVARLGGPNVPNAPHVTGVSEVDGYGLTVYGIGGATQELLSIKENGQWRPLGSDAFYENGRGLVHFGLSQDLASRLIAALRPPPSM